MMIMPKDRIMFTVDWIPVQAVMFRDMPDGFLPDWLEGSTRARDGMGPDDSRSSGPRRRLGTKDDVRATKAYLTDVSDATKQLAAEGRCLNDEAMRAG
ncbi:MAG TPA: hypothetical protein VNG69_03555 [Casimicrobiaceae bacterium]|nr:hypothetical protein [Casimicrobiaceae bacterium]